MRLRVHRARIYLTVVGLCLFLVVSGSVGAGPPPDWTEDRAAWAKVTQLPSGYYGAGVYLGYDNPDKLINPPTYPLVGGVQFFSWKLVEPDYDGDYRFDEVLRPYIEDEAANGKYTALGFQVFSGRPRAGQSADDVGIRVPAWLWARDPSVRLYNTITNDGWYVLNYLNGTYQAEYSELVNAFAQWLDDNPSLAANVAWVNIATGLHTETQPTAYYSPNADDYNFYKNILGWTSEQWVAYVNSVTDFYHAAFTSRSLPIALYLNMVPTFRNGWERDSWCDHAAALGVGLRNSGLQFDKLYYSNYLPMEKWADPAPGSGLSPAPMAWECYSNWVENESDLYWTVLCGLDKYPDNFTWMNDSEGVWLKDASHEDTFRFATEYSGVTRANTPGVWVALRERYSVWPGEPGNFNFWLWQDDSVAAGQTAAATNANVFYSGGTPYYPTEYDSRIDPNPSDRAKEGRWCRRTQQGLGQTYMYFNIDDRYRVGETEATFTVIYFDRGTDQWQLEYDATSTRYKALPPVTKTNSRTWKTWTYTVTDARLSNGQTGGDWGGVDFRLNSLNDGDDEFIHMVMVTKGGGGSSTTHNIPLSTGANLISLPLHPEDTTVTQVFSGIWSQFSRVYAYNTQTSTWTKYDKDGPPFGNTLTDVDETKGLWVYVTGATTLVASGQEPISTSIQLYAGANLVSWPSLDTVSVETAFGPIWSQFSKVYAYNAATSTWTKYDKNGPAFGNTLTNLSPGLGLWVYVGSNCTWTITN